VVRVYSYLTNHVFGDTRVKALSYWNSTRYLNIWVVKTIIDPVVAGFTLGYSPIPPAAQPPNDGIVIRHDCVGAVGTAASGPFSTQVGRSMTHEVGHWLGLSHIWGDDLCGDDNVADTPPAEDANFNCAAFPHNPNNSCGAGPNGEMFCNYMDYTDGNCENMFTLGQKQIIDYILPNFRANLTSSANLTATGTDGTPAVQCSPVSEFAANLTSVCAGVSITYTSYSFNTDTISTYSWTFPGGTPSTSNAVSPTVTYSTPGTYSASLTVSNSTGSDNRTRTSYIRVFGAAAFTPYYVNSFENAADFLQADAYLINDDGGNAWGRVTNAGSTGTASIRMNNYNNNHINEVDAYVTPSFNFTSVTQPGISFKVAYAQKTSTSDDVLRVYVSTNCGQTWTLRYYKHGSTLVTAPATALNFVPTASQWRNEIINLAAYQGMPNVRFKFECTSNTGNNMYVDDINVGTNVSVEESDFNISSPSVYPNPSSGSVMVSFSLHRDAEAELMVSDAVGRMVFTSGRKKFIAGEISVPLENNFTGGIYFLHLKTGNSVQVKRFIIIKY